MKFKMVRITYFVHASTIDNHNKVITGWNDIGLSEIGIKQAKELSTLNKTHFDMIFCSDLKRSIQTAKLAFQNLYPIKEDCRLREINNGDYTGTQIDLRNTEYQKNILQKFPNGESYKDVENRVRHFLIDIQTCYQKKHIAIIAHQAPQLALDVILNNVSWQAAFSRDWRIAGKWQPGWEFTID